MRRVTAPRLTRFRDGFDGENQEHRGLPRVTLGLGISILSAGPYSPFTWLTLHPLTQISGLRRATRRARPAASAASKTALTSL